MISKVVIDERKNGKIKISPGDIVLIKSRSRKEEELARAQLTSGGAYIFCIIGRSCIYSSEETKILVGDSIETTYDTLDILGVCDIKIEILDIKR